MQKTNGHLTRTLSTGVFTNNVFFFFSFRVSLNFAFFAEHIIKIGVADKNTKKKIMLKTGPTIS